MTDIVICDETIFAELAAISKATNYRNKIIIFRVMAIAIALRLVGIWLNILHLQKYSRTWLKYGWPNLPPFCHKYAVWLMISDTIKASQLSNNFIYMGGLKLTGETLFLCHFAWCIARLLVPKLRLVWNIFFLQNLKLSGRSMHILPYLVS